MNIFLHTYTLDVPFFLKNVRHTGIEVFGNEYTFSMDGIITCQPKKSSIGQYCKSYELSDVKLTYIQFTEILNVLGKIYRPNTYNFIYKNCNHFCDDLFELLSGKRLFHRFMLYSRIGKLFGNFRNVALCGYINSMEITRDDKILYIYALKLSKSLLQKNEQLKNTNEVIYLKDINYECYKNYNEHASSFYVIPYQSYANNYSTTQKIYYNDNLLNNAIKCLSDEIKNNLPKPEPLTSLYSFSTSGTYSFG
ncbi:PPPDE peptidase, putative [Plasmodium gaboni]|uniref:PPPDE peptidase, putative n=1 Tax=Plasmodium gaboni TaxID=647221 RepID=A0ABY1UMU3_9APIC|nr:PPPDE peptidase, putative [Plasmodium gaboni]